MWIYTFIVLQGKRLTALHFYLLPPPPLQVVLLGEGCVGKTSLVLRYCQNTFNDKHLTTLQVRIKKEMRNLFFFIKNVFLFPLAFFFLSVSCARARSPSLTHGVLVAPSLCLSACISVRPPVDRPFVCCCLSSVSHHQSYRLRFIGDAPVCKRRGVVGV